MPRRIPLLLSLALLCGASAASAQVGIEGSFGYLWPAGDAYEGVRGGTAFGAALSYVLPSEFRVSAGFLRADFSLEDDESPDLTIERLAIPHWQVFLETSYVYRMFRRFQPYVGLRIGYDRESADVEGTEIEAEGVGLSVVTGFDIVVFPVLSLNVSGFAGISTFGDGEVAGERVEHSAYGGNLVGAAIGARLALPRH